MGWENLTDNVHIEDKIWKHRITFIMTYGKWIKEGVQEQDPEGEH